LALVVEGHLTQAAGGDPFLAQTPLFLAMSPISALWNFDGDDFFGDVVAVHELLLW
jgi:hypothetical protein